MSLKRSTLVAAFLASAAMSPLLSSCAKKPVTPPVYATQAQCVDDGNTAAICAQAFSAARTSADTPHYTDKARCEAEFGTGHCESYSGGGGGFSPMLTGFMLGSMMNGGGGTTVVHHYTPVYQTVHGGYYSGSRPMTYSPPSYSSGYRSSSSISSYGSSTSSAYSGSTSRGGFGSSASAHGGCCS